MKRLVIVAENSLIVEAIRIGLRQSGEFKLLDHVDEGKASVQLIVDVAPDVVLVDDMEDAGHAVDLIRQINAQQESIAVIVLTTKMHEDHEWLDAIFDAGAIGAISKETHPMALATLIRATVDGHVVHTYTRAGSWKGGCPGAVKVADSSLTTRELEVLRLLAAGSTNGQIAAVLWVTEQTVKFHLRNVYRKLDVGNRTQAVHYAHINGLLTSAPAAVAS